MDLEAKIICLETNGLSCRKEFDPEYTCVLTGCKLTPGEDLLQKCKTLLEAIGKNGTEIVCVKRVGNHNGKPGVVKIKLPSLKDKIEILKAKRGLKDLPQYHRWYLRSSQSHEQRLLQQHTTGILEQKDNYFFNGSGKLIKKTGQHCSSNASKQPLGDIGGDLILKLEKLVSNFPTPESTPTAKK